VYNIRKAVSRLDFAPNIEAIRITDIKRGLGSFIPKPDKPVSFTALKTALKKAGYTLASAEVTVLGTLARDPEGWSVVADTSKQRFEIEGANLNQMLADAAPDLHIEITGDWKTVGEGANAREVISPRAAKKVAAARDNKAVSPDALAGIQVSAVGAGEAPATLFTPIRTTSPGLTVYKGGAITPRYSFTRQHLGDLKVDRHALRLNLSYTPTPTLQLEADIPYQRSSFGAGSRSASGQGFGNITLWAKYRFYRALEIWGDRQAAVRLGLELPTGKSTVPKDPTLPASAFVRQQLTPIAGGLSAHIDTAYSQAKGRWVYGGNIEGIARSERDGFRLGHEVRINTDLEFVMLPLKYRSPTNELFVIFETSFVHRSRGRINGETVPGSSSTEFFVAPALQYLPTSRFLVEASLQVPVVRNIGPQMLRTDRNILIGIRYLY